MKLDFFSGSLPCLTHLQASSHQKECRCYGYPGISGNRKPVIKDLMPACDSQQSLQQVLSTSVLPPTMFLYRQYYQYSAKRSFGKRPAEQEASEFFHYDINSYIFSYLFPLKKNQIDISFEHHCLFLYHILILVLFSKEDSYIKCY